MIEYCDPVLWDLIRQAGFRIPVAMTATAFHDAILAGTTETPIEPTKVTRVRENVDTISFHVSEIGKPVLIKTSYFPNWQAHGASGPYRAAPNLMVVVPTSHDVKLTYGLTKIDWLGRIVTLVAVGALGTLVTWKGIQRFGAEREPGDDEGDGEGDGDGDGAVEGADDATTTGESLETPAGSGSAARGTG